MSLTRFQRFKKWAYEKLKSRLARYFVAGTTGIGATVTAVIVCGALTVGLPATIIIGGITFLIVSVVTNKQITSSIETGEALLPLQERVEEQASQIEMLQDANKKLNDVVHEQKQINNATFNTTCLLVNALPENSNVKDACNEILCGHQKLSAEEKSIQQPSPFIHLTLLATKPQPTASAVKVLDDEDEDEELNRLLGDTFGQ